MQQTIASPTCPQKFLQYLHHRYHNTLLVGITIMGRASMIKDQDTTLAIETFNPDS